MSQSAASPRSCPCSSLIALKLSTSQSSRQTGWLVRRAWWRELGEARDQRVAVEQAGERIDDRLVAMMQLGGLQRADDRDDADEQRERRDHRRRIGERPARVRAERRREHDRDGQAERSDHDLRAKARGGHRRRQHEPGQRGAARTAAERHARADDQHRENDRDRAHALGMRARADAPLDVEEVERAQHEQPECPPADPRRREHEPEADRAGADRARHAHALARVDDAAAVKLRRAEPRCSLHAKRFGRAAKPL